MRSCRPSWGLPLFSSRLNELSDLTHSSYILFFGHFAIFATLPWTLSNHSCPSYNCVPSVRKHPCRAEWDNPFPWSASNAGINAPYSTPGLSFWLPEPTQIQLVDSQSPRSLSVILHSGHLSPSLQIYPGLFCPKCRIQHLLNCI